MKDCEIIVNRLFGIFFCFFYGNTIVGSIVSTTVIGHGFPTLDSNEINVNITEMDEALPKCGVYQADIGNSCGDGEIDDDTLYMVMGIFRSVCLKKYKDPGGTKVCIGSVV